MENNLILRVLTSRYGDNTRGSVLNHEDVDGNFIYLKGNLIKSGMTTNNNLILQSLNGELVTIPINFTGTTTGGTGVGITALTFDTHNTIIIRDATGGTFTALVNYLSGLTITGSVMNGISVTASGAYSHSEGSGTTAIGIGSHSEGNLTYASGDFSHTKGVLTESYGIGSHAEGYTSIAGDDYSHAEGYHSTSNGIASHSEGFNSIANADYSHAEGVNTSANGLASHSEGSGTTATGNHSHTEGVGTTATTDGSHVEGYLNKTTGIYSHAEGSGTTASGIASHTEGLLTISSSLGSHAEGSGATTIGNYSHAEGQSSIASGTSSHSEGLSTIAGGTYSHTEGQATRATAQSAHAEGNATLASGQGAHAEGISTIASGFASHAEGSSNTSSGFASHAEGTITTASGQFSHTEGSGTTASGAYSHAEGSSNIASGTSAHAEGVSTIASGFGAHAEGIGTYAIGNYQHVQGTFNTLNNPLPLMIIGNGTNTSNRSDLALFYSTGITFNQPISATTYYGNGSNLTGLVGANGSTITGGTFNNNTLILTNNTGGTVSTIVNNFTGLTVNGIISATTISATTFYGNGSHLSGITFSATNSLTILTDSSATTWNYTLGNCAQWNINGNRTLTITGVTSGVPSFGVLKITQGTGGNFIPVLPGFTDDIVWRLDEGELNLIGFYYDGTSYHWSSSYSVQVVYGSQLDEPLNFTATTSGSSQINLTWNAVTSATSYRLQRSTDSTFRSGVSVISSGNTTSYADTGLTASTHYYYRIKAKATGYYDSIYSYSDATTEAQAPVSITWNSLESELQQYNSNQGLRKPGSNGWTNSQGWSNETISDGQYVTFKCDTVGIFTVGLNATRTANNNTTPDWYLVCQYISTLLYGNTNPGQNDSGVSFASTDILKLAIVGADFIIQKSTNNGASYSTIGTLSSIASGAYYVAIKLYGGSNAGFNEIKKQS